MAPHSLSTIHQTQYHATQTRRNIWPKWKLLGFLQFFFTGMTHYRVFRGFLFLKWYSIFHMQKKFNTFAQHIERNLMEHVQTLHTGWMSDKFRKIILKNSISSNPIRRSPICRSNHQIWLLQPTLRTTGNNIQPDNLASNTEECGDI